MSRPLEVDSYSFAITMAEVTHPDAEEDVLYM